MEEIKPDLVGDDSYVDSFCANMYHKVTGKNPVTGLFNGIRIIMFVEEE
jgi:hypothetical protein